MCFAVEIMKILTESLASGKRSSATVAWWFRPGLIRRGMEKKKNGRFLLACSQSFLWTLAETGRRARTAKFVRLTILFGTDFSFTSNNKHPSCKLLSFFFVHCFKSPLLLRINITLKKKLFTVNNSFIGYSKINIEFSQVGFNLRKLNFI